MESYSERTSDYGIIYRTLRGKPFSVNYPFYPIDCFEECSYLKKKKKKKKKNTLKLLLFTVTYGPLPSLFGDNLLASWSKHCVTYNQVTTSPALLYRSMLQMLKHCFDNNKTLTLHVLFLSFFLSFFGYSLIRTLDNVTNYNPCSQRKRVWSDVFKQSPVRI